MPLRASAEGEPCRTVFEIVFREGQHSGIAQGGLPQGFEPAYVSEGVAPAIFKPVVEDRR